ncbi:MULTISPECIES: DUF4160 domain-containing protein [Chromatiaceae]|uniref:DUF4160 domain-containing protein n=1 Tax=Thiospirillum jenense TaxID=1653858 RepID=A0A839H9M7_9GAMM|nr:MULTISPECIES: DUF4160 domain-containing protein [Chromatiaceae]MBB1077952.1 DUF4160 domain-containing protein [Rhodoferax jenense]MBB1125963.1 DUF4160 domain-containing protein [Thiospirillum jenense]MBV5309650.1 DUF4160 domain-containing protein [Chromatium okenii]
MPTLLNQNGFKFIFYANEHPPPHVHVLKGDTWAKIEMRTAQVITSTLKPKDEKMAVALVKQHQHTFLEVWNDWFSR